MHTRQHIFTHFYRKKRPLREKAHTAKKMFYLFLLIFSGREFFMDHEFSHLTTMFFIGKNSYFSYTIFFSHHNRIYSHHSRVFSHHNRVFSHHNRIFSHHSEVFSDHNDVFSEPKRAKIRRKWSDSS